MYVHILLCVCLCEGAKASGLVSTLKDVKEIQSPLFISFFLVPHTHTQPLLTHQLLVFCTHAHTGTIGAGWEAEEWGPCGRGLLLAQINI